MDEQQWPIQIRDGYLVPDQPGGNWHVQAELDGGDWVSFWTEVGSGVVRFSVGGLDHVFTMSPDRAHVLAQHLVDTAVEAEGY